MTYEEATALKNALENPNDDCIDEHGVIRISPQFRDIIIPYIENRIPKKPKGLEREKDKHFLFGRCPVCETLMCRNDDFPEYHAFCDVCGQAIDWSDENDEIH